MSLLELKDKVGRWLTEIGLRGIEITERGGYSFRFESTRVFVDIVEVGSEEHRRSLVHITAPFLQRAPISPELFEWVARSCDDWMFGHLGMSVDDEDKTCIVVLTHTLLGDYLDPEEFNQALIAVTTTANDIDDDLVARFGGETFHSD